MMKPLHARRFHRVGHASSLARAALALFWILTASWIPLAVEAQSSTTGAISGRVLDVQGHGVADAEISISSSYQSFHTHGRTSSSGDFLIPSLEPAEYRVEIHAAGLGPATIRQVRVEVGETARLHLVLSPQTTVVTQIDVDADQSADLEETPAANSTVISQKEITQLPENGRGWQSFALMTPQGNAAASTAESGLLSFRGLAPTQNASSIDGGDADQSFNGSPHGSGTDPGPEAEEESESEGQSAKGSSGRDYSSGSGAGRQPGAEFTFPEGAVREFRVVGQNYSSLYGHAAGAVITTVSRAGTDSFHGSAFYQVRESAWDATNPFSLVTRYTAGAVTTSLVKPHDQRQQFGGALGGPLLPKRYPHKLYFFYALEMQRRGFPAVSSPENPDFYNLSDTQRALLGNRGVASRQIDAALSYVDSLTGTVPRRADQTVNFLRWDAHLTRRNQFSLQYNRSRFNSPAGSRSAPVVNRGVRSLGDQEIAIDSVLGRWVYSRSSSFSSELRVQYNRDRHSEQAQKPLPQEPTIAAGGLSPQVSIGPQGFSFGTPASLGRQAAPDEHRIQAAEMATRARGRHLLQAGFDYSFVRDTTDSLANSFGTFHYDSGATGGKAGGLVDWITDYTFNVNTIPNGGCSSIHAPIHDFCFRSFSQTFGKQNVSFSTQEFAGFVQERWETSAKLSLTAGLRYEYELLPLPQQPNAAVDAVFSARGATSIFPEDRNNFGPRIAAAWQPFGEGLGTIRVAYGLYFGRLPSATIRSALIDTATANSATRVRILPTTITPCPQVANQGFGYPCTYTAAPPGGIVATTSLTVFDRRFRMPMVQQGSFSLERDIRHFATVSASYLLNLDRQLPNSVDINLAPSTGTRRFQLVGGTKTVGVRDGDTFTLPFYNSRLSSSFGPVTAITSNANATYNALVLQARHRSRDGLEFRASWTWSKTIDFGQNLGSVPQTNGQLDPYDNRYDKGLSALNFSHKLVASAIWQPNPSLASPFRRRISSGWLIVPALTETSGRPFSYNIFGGSRPTGGHESINGSGGDVYLPTVGRDTLRLPDTLALDVRLARDLPFSETTHLQAYAEAFNLTNHVNYTSTTSRAFLVGSPLNGVTPLMFQDAATVAAEGLNTRPFAALTSSSSESAKERQLQFGLRLEF